MNKSITSFVKSIFAGMTFIAVSSMAQAAPISYTYTHAINPSHKLETSLEWALWKGFYVKSDTYQLGYDLFSGSWSNEGSPTSYDPTVDSLTDLSITLNFAAPDWGSAIFKLWEGLSFSTSFGDANIQTAETEAEISLSNIDLSSFDLNELTPDIQLTLTGWGSVLLTGYTLNFTGNRADAVAVPTPSSLALLSVGLLGAGWFSRRRTQSANS